MNKTKYLLNNSKNNANDFHNNYTIIIHIRIYQELVNRQRIVT